MSTGVPHALHCDRLFPPETSIHGLAAVHVRLAQVFRLWAWTECPGQGDGGEGAGASCPSHTRRSAVHNSREIRCKPTLLGQKLKEPTHKHILRKRVSKKRGDDASSPPKDLKQWLSSTVDPPSRSTEPPAGRAGRPSRRLRGRPWPGRGPRRGGPGRGRGLPDACRRRSSIAGTA